ncbi:MAG: hypothetical protein JSW38_13505 [Dehalococcoidia bacterium]|nr:MAG: hypothetical protein JSW38_13505 [Dehalococcoidia bacterium]
MKNTCLIVLIALLVAATALSCGGGGTFTTYTDTECGWSISHPSDWFRQVHEPCFIHIHQTDPTTADYTPTAPQIHIEIAPTGFYNRSSGMTLREFVDFTLYRPSLSGAVDSETISVEESIIGGLPAVRAIYVSPGDSREPSLKKMAFFIAGEPVMARITYIAELDEFDRYARVFEQIVETFHLH